MVLVDFSRAYDRTWRTGLLHKMAKLGIPRCFTAWFRAFLTDRQACVRLNEVRSKFRVLRDGTPQGAVTSPTMFNIYINDITAEFPAGVQTSMYADDLAVWCSDQDMSVAEQKVQAALERLEAWADEWKMTVSLEKTVSTVFSLDPNEAKKEAKLVFNNKPVQHCPTPTFLGVTMDRTLTFGTHVKTVKARMKSRNNVLRAISGTSWGCSTSDLRSVYLAFSRACADYAAGAWMPGISDTNLEDLEIAQRHACRTITGCVKRTPTGALTREADLLPFTARRKLLAATAVEKHTRDLPGNPVQRLLRPGNRPHKRLKRRNMGWAKMGLETIEAAGLGGLPREPLLNVASTPPWEAAPENVRIHTRLDRNVPRTGPPEERRRAAEETLSRLPRPDVVVFTDGSATAGTEDGGAGAVVWEEGRETTRIRAPAGKITSSYIAELHALNEALKYLEDRAPTDERQCTIRICTDSQSALTRLKEGPADQREKLPDEIWKRLKKIGRRHRVDMQWVPGHAGVEENEIADEVAKQAASLPQNKVPINLNAAKARLKLHLGREWVEGNRSTQHYDIVGPGRIKPGDKLGLSRADSVTLARMRTGKSMLLRSFRHAIGLEQDPTCQDCDDGEPEDLAHLMTECPQKDRMRHQIFGRHDPTLAEAFADPDVVLAYLRRVGRL